MLSAAWFACIGALTVASCAGVHLRDETKAAVAAEAKAKFQAAKIAEVTEAEQKNLDKLLQVELAAIRANHALRFKIDTLRMADDERVSVGDWLREAEDDIEKLGFSGSGDVKDYLKGQNEIQSALERMSLRQSLISLTTSKPLPVCEKDEKGQGLPDVEKYLKSLGELTKEQRGLLKADYKAYKKNCEKLLNFESRLTSGPVNEAYQAWVAAEVALAAVKLKAAEQATKIKDARKDYDEAVKDAAAAGAKTSEAMKTAAKKLVQALEDASKASDVLGLEVLPKERSEAIATILTAVATGEAGETPKADSELAPAIEVAKGIPSLARDMEALVAKGRRPSVSNLLIELQHQIIQREYANARRAIIERRVALLKLKFEALVRQAEHLRDFKLALCNFAVMQAGGKHPSESRKDCDNFEVTEKGLQVKCNLIPVGPSCALASPWKKALNPGSGFKKGAKRELYAAIAAIGRVRTAKAAVSEIEFKLIDLDHRDSVAANRSALEAWNNLIGTPISELAAYHDSGIKPAAIADLIVKALGLGAIAGALAK